MIMHPMINMFRETYLIEKHKKTQALVGKTDRREQTMTVINVFH